MNQDKHRLYVKLMNKYWIKDMEGISWGSVLHTRLWKSLDGNLFKEIFNVIKGILFTTYETSTRFTENKILLIRSCNGREDYNKIWNNFKSCIKDYDLIELKRKRKIDFHIIRNIKKYKIITKNMPSDMELRARLHLSTWIMRITRLEEIDFSRLNQIKIVIFFFDGDPVENYLCQKIKLKFPTSTTITLQHGQYVYKKEDYDINQTGILNLTADYIFAWGEFTEQQFIRAGVDNKRVIKVGNLLNPTSKKIESKVMISKGTFGVICDAPSYSFAFQKNNDMLNIAYKLANKFRLKFWIKLHPFDSLSNYSIDDNEKSCLGFYPKDKLMSDFVQDIDFAISHVSSAYIDLLILNCKSFKYDSEVDFPLVENKEDTFDSLTSLFKKYEKWEKMSIEKKLEYLSINRNKYIEEGNALKKYKDEIEKILSEYESC